VWLQRANLAPGTTHACKSLFPEEVYVSVGLKADLSIFLDAPKCELSDLLREECSRFMNRRRVRQQLAQARQPRNCKAPQLPEFYLERPRTWLNRLMQFLGSKCAANWVGSLTCFKTQPKIAARW
jgi:hypothetical protein